MRRSARRGLSLSEESGLCPKPVPEVAPRLVERFDLDRKASTSPDYKEERLRAEFLNPHRCASGVLRLTRFLRTIAVTDRQIDELVYELYGLSGKEVGIVEGY